MGTTDPSQQPNPAEISWASEPTRGQQNPCDVVSTNNLRYRLTGSNLVTAIAGLALLLLAPFCVSRSEGKPISLGLPGVLSGDEPHYLVLINSLISDGDFDLANNYQDVHRGGPQAGRIFAGQLLDHHVNWYEDGRLVK